MGAFNQILFNVNLTLISDMAYGKSGSSGPRFLNSSISYLPIHANLKNSKITLDLYNQESDENDLQRILQIICNDEGNSYPFYDMSTLELFRSYYTTHDSFVAKIDDKVVGAFYVKPNFPGRSGHICNGGFIVDPDFRGQRIATFLAYCFRFLARDLGYEASFFNLVYESNTASVKLWRRFGFTEIGVIPKAGKLKGKDGKEFYSDAIQMNCDFETHDYEGQKIPDWD